MTVLHVTWGPTCHTPWEPVPRSWGATVRTDCCVRRVPRREAEVRWGLQPWYDPHPTVACRSGHGCKADPRRRHGREGRLTFVWGPGAR